MLADLRRQAAAWGLPPSRPLLIYPAHAFRYDHHLEDAIELLEPLWVHGRHYRITAPTRHTAIDTGDDDQVLANFLIRQMTLSDLMWAFAGGYASRKPWIMLENAYAEVRGMPALSITPRGQEVTSLVATANHTRPAAGWQQNSIVRRSLELLPVSLMSDLYPAPYVLRFLHDKVDPHVLRAATEEWRRGFAGG